MQAAAVEHSCDSSCRPPGREGRVGHAYDGPLQVGPSQFVATWDIHTSLVEMGSNPVASVETFAEGHPA
jgi:hypothetical protein